MWGGSGVKFNPDTDIPAGSLEKKIIIVTGGNIGLGRETIQQLAKHNPGHIYLAARNKEKADNAIKEIQSSLSSPAKISFLELDLTSFASIKSAAKQFTTDNDRLDILINNAGIMACPPGVTKEGYETQFGTNHVGHALFTNLLLPTLQKTASNPSSSDVRIVNLSSAGESLAPSTSWTFDKMKTPDAGGINSWQRYGQSKLANVHYTHGLAQHYPNITSIAVHPGAISTNLVNAGPAQQAPWVVKSVLSGLARIFLGDVRQGALNQLWAATAPLDSEKGPKTSTFYHPVGVTGKDSKLAKDSRLTDELWDWTEKQLEGQSIDN